MYEKYVCWQLSRSRSCGWEERCAYWRKYRLLGGFGFATDMVWLHGGGRWTRNKRKCSGRRSLSIAIMAFRTAPESTRTRACPRVVTGSRGRRHRGRVSGRAW